MSRHIQGSTIFYDFFKEHFDVDTKEEVDDEIAERFDSIEDILQEYLDNKEEMHVAEDILDLIEYLNEEFGT